MEIVAHGEAVGELLHQRRLPLLGIVEAHLIALTLVGRRVGRHHEGEKVVETTGRVGFGRMGKAAVLLLGGLKETVGHIPGIVVVGEARPLQLKRARRKTASAGHPGIEHAGRQAGGSGREKLEVVSVDIRLAGSLKNRNARERRPGRALRRRSPVRVGLRHQVGRAVRRLGGVRRAEIPRRLRRDRVLLGQ